MNGEQKTGSETGRPRGGEPGGEEREQDCREAVRGEVGRAHDARVIAGANAIDGVRQRDERAVARGITRRMLPAGSHHPAGEGRRRGVGEKAKVVGDETGVTPWTDCQDGRQRDHEQASKPTQPREHLGVQDTVVLGWLATTVAIRKIFAAKTRHFGGRQAVVREIL